MSTRLASVVVIASMLCSPIAVGAVADGSGSTPSSALKTGKVDDDCTFGDIELRGRVQVVEHFPDIEVKRVRHFPDLRVQRVEFFPDECGKWQFVKHHPDFKIQYVEHFPDIEVQMVKHFPGLP